MNNCIYLTDKKHRTNLCDVFCLRMSVIFKSQLPDTAALIVHNEISQLIFELTLVDHHGTAVERHALVGVIDSHITAV